MILQILAHAGEMMQDGDAQRSKPFAFADVGALENDRRSHGARRRESLPGSPFVRCASILLQEKASLVTLATARELEALLPHASLLLSAVESSAR